MQFRSALARLLPWRASPKRRALRRGALLALLAVVGPGLIAAIAGDDAGGIATYASVGAKYGYDLLWALIVITFALIVVQEMTVRLTVVTGKGLSDLIREQFGVRTTALAMLVLFIANGAVTISEFVGIAAASELFGISRYITVPLAAVAVWWVVVRGNYKIAERVFLVIAAGLLVYPLSAFVVNPDWAAVLRGSLIPTIIPERDYILLMIAVIGTTISPYMQFTLSAATLDKGTRMEELPAARAETIIGALLSDLIAFFIIVATGATLYVNGITDIETAEQAAQALEPIAGPLARTLFAVGLLGASLLAASILPLSTTYAICEAFGWERGVNHELREAPAFHGIYTFMIVTGAVITLIPGLPLFQVLVQVYLLNGILLPVLLVLMIRLSNNRRLMGKHVNSRTANVLAWGLTVVLMVLTAFLIVMTFVPL